MWILAICFLVVAELGLVGIEQTAWAPEPVRCMRKAVAVLIFCGSLAPPLNQKLTQTFITLHAENTRGKARETRIGCGYPWSAASVLMNLICR